MAGRRRLGLKAELLLALLPTATVLLVLVLALVEALSSQRLLFASLASSAFLICMAVAITAALVLMQRVALWMMRRMSER